MPSEVKVETKITKKIKLNIPIISAAMDTVTEAKTAIAMAQEGGLGVIHKNLSIDCQSEEVEKVKKYEGGMIIEPHTISPDATGIQALEIMTTKNFTGLPVTENGGKLLGIITMRDLRYEKNLHFKIQKLMTQKKKDVIVDTTNVNFHANGDNTLYLAEIDEAFKVNDVALNQIATKIGLSKKYLDKMMDGHKSILQDNINYWFRNTPKQQMIRTVDGTARAFLSDKYKRVDNDDIANAVLPILLDKKYDVKSCAITDTKMYIKASLPSLQREVTVGDVVESGVIISNSEVGHGSVDVSPFIYRLVCENGMKVNDARLNSRHLTSSQATQDGVYEILSDEAKELDSRALISKVRDVVASTSNEVRFMEQVQAMTDASNIKIKKPKKVIEILENKFSLTKDEGDNILENLMHNDTGNKEPNVWATVNSITKLGNTMEDYDRGTEMQRIGGVLLTMPELIAA